MREKLAEESIFNSVIFRIVVVIAVIIGYDIQKTTSTQRHS